MHPHPGPCGPSAHKLHWRDMGDKAKIQSMDAVAAIGASHSIVLGCTLSWAAECLPTSKRARRKCLELMLTHLETLGVNRHSLESRGEAKDEADIMLLQSLRRKGICERITLTHEESYRDSRLWVPDQVLGARPGTRVRPTGA